MKTAITLVGIIITLPFLALEAMIKLVMYILYLPLIISIAIIYPITKIYEWNLHWIKKWYIYATTWKRGFFATYIFNLWKIN